jgi:DNA-binding winged helix-turn-helix (wHTH) protein
MRYVFGNYTLDTERYELRRAEVRIPLRPKVFQLLTYLIAHCDRVVLKDEIIAYLWPNQFIGDTALKSCIMTARKAVGDAGRSQRIIQTLHGHGYRFVAAVTPEEQGPLASAALPGLSRASAPLVPSVETVPCSVTAVHHPSTPLLEQEHKQVTVLWCTLAHATALATHLGPEAMHSLMSEVLAAAQHTIQRYEGTITQYMGTVSWHCLGHLWRTKITPGAPCWRPWSCRNVCARAIRASLYPMTSPSPSVSGSTRGPLWWDIWTAIHSDSIRRSARRPTWSPDCCPWPRLAPW